MTTDNNIKLRVWVGEPKGLPTLLLCVVSPKCGAFNFNK